MGHPHPFPRLKKSRSCLLLGQQRDVREHNTPAFRQSNPGLALPSTRGPSVDLPLEGQRYTGKVFPKGDNIEASDRSRQINRRTSFAKGLNLVDPIKALRRPKTNHMRRSPEHALQGFYIVIDQGLLVARVEFPEFGDGLRVVDAHLRQNNFLAGSTDFGIAALTVIMGSFTTWLMRSFIATLHSR
jgi:hypothetical protein